MRHYLTLGLSMFLLTFNHTASAQSRLAPQNMMALCQGLGQATATVAQGREQGVPDDKNEGVQVLKRISQHRGNDFVSHIGQFLNQTQDLPYLWQGMLYTHACWHSYQDNPAQVSLMSSLLPFRCDMDNPAMDCIDETFLTLPGEAAQI